MNFKRILPIISIILCLFVCVPLVNAEDVGENGEFITGI